MPLHPLATVEHRDDLAVVYGPHTGRAVTLARATLDRLAELPAVQARLRRLGLLDDLDAAELVDWVVCRHRATHLLVDEPALWHPVPAAHGSGGHHYTALPLDPLDLAIYQAINDGRTVRHIANSVGAAPDEVLRRLQPWLARTRQAVQLRPTPPRAGDPGLRRVVGPSRAANRRTEDQHGADGGTTLATYHLESIDDGTTHFDDRETTVAHALAIPHPGLSGRAYGRALREALGWNGPVVEVGCGTGELAAAWLDAGSVPYLRIDLSPELLRTQATAAPTSVGVLADGTRLPLRDGSVPFLLSNEVLADLAAVPMDRIGDATRRRIEAQGLRPAGWANVGAWALIDEVARVLAPGGQAVLTEFGTPDEAAEEAVQLDHPEVSIRFDDLVRIAHHHGLSAKLARLDERLGVDLRAPQVARISWMALRARARAVGIHLPARAWTPNNLPRPFAMDGVQFDTLADEGPGPLITRFWALTVSKPT